jgi:pyruvate/2-oxoacid:ferredoxin oxidoreductase alpha subunit
MRELIECSHAVAEVVSRARVQVIASHPITPQTHIAERLAELTFQRDLAARFISVESEHSAMACCISAALSEPGYSQPHHHMDWLSMHELLHWASMGGCPS